MPKHAAAIRLLINVVFYTHFSVSPKIRKVKLLIYYINIGKGLAVLANQNCGLFELHLVE
jgi:hypothetical protein